MSNNLKLWLNFADGNRNRNARVTLTEEMTVRIFVGDFLDQQLQLPIEMAKNYCLVIDSGMGQKKLCDEEDLVMDLDLEAHSKLMMRRTNEKLLVLHWADPQYEPVFNTTHLAGELIAMCEEYFALKAIPFSIVFIKNDQPFVLVANMPLRAQEWDGEDLMIFPTYIPKSNHQLIEQAMSLNVTALNPLRYKATQWILSEADDNSTCHFPSEVLMIAHRFRTEGAYVFVSPKGIGIEGSSVDFIPYDCIESINVDEREAVLTTNSRIIRLVVDRPNAFLHSITERVTGETYEPDSDSDEIHTDIGSVEGYDRIVIAGLFILSFFVVVAYFLTH